MEVIPVVNCPDFKCVKKRLVWARDLGSEWVHLDIADGVFARSESWRNPQELADYLGQNDNGGFFAKIFGIQTKTPALNLEIHLMVADPEKVLESWLKAGAKRVIVHIEAVAAAWLGILDKCKEYGAELMVAVNPETPPDNLILLLDRFPVRYVQCLAVPPGPAGQKFEEIVLAKIKLLKKNYPALKIEVDGGVNPETAKLAKEAGAEILATGTYIWTNLSHKAAFEKLKNI